MSAFKVYRSSAGSGKTYTLVLEFIALAISEKYADRFKKILAITFTNKAAEEMKERVIKNLYLLSLPVSNVKYDAQFLNAVSSFTNLPPEVVQERSSKAFSFILHNYHLLKITTIDKFTVSLVNSFSFELSLDLDRTIELDTAPILDTAIENLLQKSKADTELSTMLLDFYRNKLEEEKKLNLKGELQKFGKLLFSDVDEPYIEKAKLHSRIEFINAYEKAKLSVRKVNDRAKYLANEIITITHLAGLSTQKRKGLITGTYSALIKVSKNGFYELAFEPNLMKMLNKSPFAKTADKSDIQKYKTIENEVLIHLNELYNLFNSFKNSFYADNVVLKNAYSMALLNDIEQEISKYKNENRIIFLNEYHKLVEKIVLKEPAPFIFERFGERIRNVFVDEFQDTSTSQFINLIPLMSECLSTRDKVLLVGDAKQSIYRWRNGNAKQFIDLPYLPKNNNGASPFDESNFNAFFNVQQLVSNFRSHKVIIEFNNRFFKSLSEIETFKLPLISSIFSDVSQLSSDKKSQGYVQIQIVEKQKGSKKKENEKSINDFILESIQHCFTKKIKPGDICVLTRKNDEADEVVKLLNQNGIEASSGSAIKLSDGKDVLIIVQFLKCIHFSANLNDVRQLGIQIAHYRNIYLSVEKDLFFMPKTNPNAAFNTVLHLFAINYSPDLFNKLNLIEKIEYIVNVIKLNNDSALLTGFLENVNEYSLKQGSDEASFLDWWEIKGKKKTIQTITNELSVQVFTIHKSKGLEFPIVILPYLTFNDNSEKYLWIDQIPGYSIGPLRVTRNNDMENYSFTKDALINEKSLELLDKINMLYVAFTRAEEGLFIFLNKNIQGLSANLADCIYKTFEFSGTKLEFGELKNRDFNSITSKPVSSTAIAKTQNFLPWFQKLKVGSKFLDALEKANSATTRGTVVHEIMSRINFTSEIDSVLNFYYESGKILENDKAELIEQTKLFLESSIYQSYFNENTFILNEYTLVDENGNTFRPDKILLNTSISSAVIDFKTGEKTKKHRSQMLNYAALIKKIGYKRLDSYLYYIDYNEWVKIDE